MNTQNIATLAANLNKKPNKAQLFEVVTDIINTNAVNEAQLANLYSFFMPPVIKIKTPFHWLVKARGNKDVRYYLNHVYSDGTKTMSTDGHRAHVINEERELGWYDDNDQLIHDPEWAKYPDIAAVMPCTGVHYIINIEDLPIESIDSKTFVYVMPDGMGMNKQYIDQACGMDGCKLEYYEDAKKCKVTYDNAEAVIMGIRL